MHLTEQELNEYLDNGSADRAMIEAHLASCDECAARLSALQALFTELDSLPAVSLSRDIAAHVILRPGRFVPQLPRWLTLTATLQAVAALVALIAATPFISGMLPKAGMLSFTTLFIQIQSQWMIFLDGFSTFTLNPAEAFNLPTFPPAYFPTLEISTLIITFAGVSVLWIFGNGLLLRNQKK